MASIFIFKLMIAVIFFVEGVYHSRLSALALKHFSRLHKLPMTTQQSDISDSTARTGKEGVAGDISKLC
jgi:hypothetical protein